SYRHPCLAGVPASTHNPQVVRDTILDHRWSWDLARLSVSVHRQDVDLTHHVAMRLKPTGRALVLAPPRFVAMPATGTGLGRVLLIHQLDFDPFGCRLVLDVPANFAVVPLAHFLVVLSPLVDSVGDVPHVADHDGPGLLRDGRIHNRAADLVFHVPHHSVVLGLH